MKRRKFVLLVSMSLKGRWILVVDDELDVNFTIKLALEDEGFEVDIFDNPQIVLSSFKPKFYDLILLDIKMPKIDRQLWIL